MTTNRQQITQSSQFSQQSTLFGNQDKQLLSPSKIREKEDQLSEAMTEDQKNEDNPKDESKKGIFVNRLLIDCTINEVLPQNSENQQTSNDQRESSQTNTPLKQNFPNKKLSRLQLYCSLSKGDILGIDLLPFYQQFDNIYYTEHCNTRINYNAFRSNTENFLKGIGQIKNEKISFSGVLKINAEGRKCNEKKIHSLIYKNLKFFNQGAHKDILTSLKMINLKENYLLTSSMDSFIKIWNLNTGELKASLNINHPLPIVWKIEKEILKDGKKKIIFALKILDVIQKKYGKDLTYSEQRNIRVTDFLAQILNKEIDSEQFLSKDIPIDQKEEALDQIKKLPLADWINKLVDPKDQKSKVQLMKDEYSPRDLKYEKSKQFFQTELTGPSLKRMEANKRVAMATKAWKQENESKEAELEYQLKNENNLTKNLRAEEREELLVFLGQNYRDKLLKNEFSKISEDFCKGTVDLKKKLDLHLYQKRHLSHLHLQMGSNNEFQRKKNTKRLSNLLSGQSSQTNSQLFPQQKPNNFSDVQNSMNIQDQTDQNDYGSSMLFKQKRNENSLIYSKQFTIISDKKNKYKKNKNKKQIQTERSPDFYQQSILKQLIDEQGNSFNMSYLMPQKKNSLSNLAGSSVLNNSIANQSSIIQNTNSCQMGVDITMSEDPTLQDQANNNNNSAIKNNTTTIGPNSTVLNTSQSEINEIYDLKVKKQPQKINKLSNVLKSMDQKIKRSQQSFKDDVIISQFLTKRNELYFPPDNQSEVSTLKQTDNFEKKGQTSRNTNLPQIKLTDSSYFNSSQLNTEPYDPSKKQNINSSRSQKSQKSKILTKNGIDVLKKVLYDTDIENKHMHTSIGSSKTMRSLNKSTPQLYSYQVNDQPFSYEIMNTNRAPPLRNEDGLKNMQQEMPQRGLVEQKLLSLKRTLNHNMQNAFELYQHIEDSLSSKTPQNIIDHKNK